MIFWCCIASHKMVSESSDSHLVEDLEIGRCRVSINLYAKVEMTNTGVPMFNTTRKNCFKSESLLSQADGDGQQKT
jgi:hypothetical protein